MKLIQINMSDEENKIVTIHKVNHNLKTKAEAIKHIIKKVGDKK